MNELCVPDNHILIPHISLIIFYVIFFQELYELLLIAHMLMVMFLIMDVPGSHIHLRGIYRKNAITFLPIEVGIAFSFCLDPFGRSLLYLLDQSYLSHFFGKQAKNVNMIFMASNLNRVAFKSFVYSTEIIKQAFFYGFINKRFAMFGAEYDMGIDF